MIACGAQNLAAGQCERFAFPRRAGHHIGIGVSAREVIGALVDESGRVALELLAQLRLRSIGFAAP